MNNINSLLETLNRLLEVASCHDRSWSGASTLRYKLLGIEDGIAEVKIENWNNHYYSIDLNGESIQLVRMYREQLREWKYYVAHCLRHKQARKENSIVFGEVLVRVIDESVVKPPFYNNAVYTITYDDGSTSDWYGYRAEDALSNSAPYIRDRVPVTIQLSEAG